MHVDDWESDIHELYRTAQDLGTSFLVRVQTNTLATLPLQTTSRHRSGKSDATNFSRSSGVAKGVIGQSIKSTARWSVALV